MESSGGPRRVLIGASGSVASVKVTELVCRLRDLGVSVRVIWTDAAAKFRHAAEQYNKEEFEKYRKLVDRDIQVVEYVDADEWDYHNVRLDPVVHIELRKWADILLVAPLSANTLAKLANGISDNLLTSVARAWDLSKPFLVAPAMNTFMWDHPITEQHLSTLQKWGIKVIPPISKTLACGDTGSGALASVSDILSEVSAAKGFAGEPALPSTHFLGYGTRSYTPRDQARVLLLAQRYASPASDIRWDDTIDALSIDNTTTPASALQLAFDLATHQVAAVTDAAQTFSFGSANATRVFTLTSRP